MNAELGERVRERTLQLEAINQELEAFSYSVSHDLRGPLRRIEGFSRILLMSHTDRLDEQGQGLLSRVRNSIQHMGRLIDDLLKLARVNQEAFVRGEIDLSAMAREVLASLAAGEPERYVECVVADGLAVNADRGLMRVALENLIGNAWKFTGNEPRARIEVGAGEVDGETVYHVRDNGDGLRHGLRRQSLRRFSAPARPGGVRGQRHRARHGAAHHHAPRRQDLGRQRPRQGRRCSTSPWERATRRVNPIDRSRTDYCAPKHRSAFRMTRRYAGQRHSVPSSLGHWIAMVRMIAASNPPRTRKPGVSDSLNFLR